MARLSDVIELFLKDLLKDTEDGIEIQRNELACTVVYYCYVVLV